MKYHRPVTLLFIMLLSSSVLSQPPLRNGESLYVDSTPARYWSASHSGGPGKDGIPSIDKPGFLSAEEADPTLAEGDIVMGVFHKGQARAYPQKILVWHEIVNDTLGGDNISVTYCPLTGTGMGFFRGNTEFGVSGRLVNSNMLMYDRATDTYWPQILATGIRGPLAGETLQELGVVWTTWGKWKSRYPDSQVLSSRTGHARNYRQDPYGAYNPKSGYYAEKSPPIMPVMNESSMNEASGKFPPKKEFFGIRTAGEALAVDMEILAQQGVMHYRSHGEVFLIVYDQGLDTAWAFRGPPGQGVEDLSVGDIDFSTKGPTAPVLDSLEPVIGFKVFWFAWQAFYPKSVILDGNHP